MSDLKRYGAGRVDSALPGSRDAGPGDVRALHGFCWHYLLAAAKTAPCASAQCLTKPLQCTAHIVVTGCPAAVMLRACRSA
jgi:hypothetical protein